MAIRPFSHNETPQEEERERDRERVGKRERGKYILARKKEYGKDK